MANLGVPYLRIVADNVYHTGVSEERHGKAVAYLQSIRDAPETPDAVTQAITNELMIHAVFGSNSIERAGLGQDATSYLCHQTLSPRVTSMSDENSSDLSNYHILRGRQEVIQHLRAYQHFLHRFVTLGDDMTEGLIKETHEILCSGVPVFQQDGREIPSDEYGGSYREVIVGAGNTNFVVPSHVPRKMAELCVSIRDDLQQAQAASSLDPFSLAAKHSLEFVQIHPFLGGNDRMCRIILNAILFRFCDILVAIGEAEEDRVPYINIKKRASQDMEGRGEYADFVLEKAMRTLRKMKQKIHGKSQ